MTAHNLPIYLRKPTLRDKDALIAAYERSKALHNTFTFAPTNMDTYIAQKNRYLICMTANHNLVGTFNISNIVRGWLQSGHLGYEVFVPYQQQGFMHQGIMLLLEEAFTKLNLHRLEANIQTDNLSSINLVKKAGFTKKGYAKNYLRVGGTEWKDHERWAIVNENWKEIETVN